MSKHTDYGLLITRIGFGLLFFLAGLGKIIGGIPGFAEIMKLPVFLAWIIALGELFGGVALLIGFLTRWAGAGLSIIMIGAIFLVYLPAFDMANPMSVTNLLIHIALFAALVGLAFSGSGRYAVKADN